MGGLYCVWVVVEVSVAVDSVDEDVESVLELVVSSEVVSVVQEVVVLASKELELDEVDVGCIAVVVVVEDEVVVLDVGVATEEVVLDFVVVEVVEVELEILGFGVTVEVVVLAETGTCVVFTDVNVDVEVQVFVVVTTLAAFFATSKAFFWSNICFKASESAQESVVSQVEDSNIIQVFKNSQVQFSSPDKSWVYHQVEVTQLSVVSQVQVLTSEESLEKLHEAKNKRPIIHIKFLFFIILFLENKKLKFNLS